MAIVGNIIKRLKDFLKLDDEIHKKAKHEHEKAMSIGSAIKMHEEPENKLVSVSQGSDKKEILEMKKIFEEHKQEKKPEKRMSDTQEKKPEIKQEPKVSHKEILKKEPVFSKSLPEKTGEKQKKDVVANPLASQPVKKTAPKKIAPKKRRKKLGKKAGKEKVKKKKKIMRPKYKKIAEKLSREVDKLKANVYDKKIKPQQALGGVQVIYAQIKDQQKSVGDEINETKALMDFAEKDYMKRKITEEEFREKMLEYRDKLRVLEMQKKSFANNEKSLGETVKVIPTAIPVNLEMIASSKNVATFIEPVSVQKPIQAKTIKQPQASSKNVPLKPMQSAPVQSAPMQAKATTINMPEPAPQRTGQVSEGQQDIVDKDSIMLDQFLEAKASGKMDKQKLNDIEKKVHAIMHKYNLSEKEVEQKIGSADNEAQLIESVNKLVDLLDKKKESSFSEKSERIETAVRFTETAKPVEEEKGVDTKIRQKTIITDFDRVLDLIEKKGKMKVGEMASELKLSKSRIEEVATLLKKEKQVELIYHTFGDAVIQTPYYLEKSKQQKEKEKQEAKDKAKKAKGDSK